MSIYLDEYTLGQEFNTPARTFTGTDAVVFGCMTGDLHPNHFDREKMARGQFGQRITHGLLGLSISHGLLFQIDLLRDSSIAFLGIEDWKFEAPIFFDDTIYCHVTVADIRPSKSKPDRGVLKLHFELINQHGTVCQSGIQTLMMWAHRPASEKT
ncbi:MaoC/PaaZ C-terminal domain-containing protein [uncultured Oscillibacter sp.]|uniref:MaoC/PaaZ C-terminal domain-containing protein n=1 Tax=uncultured Oscillibacter sp. TaxID=876091 RepID=UPI0025DE0E08|nr:MaoC/PaaZ C-terminal domain-containing protein [uncultured Oscillibacter sp.]